MAGLAKDFGGNEGFVVGNDAAGIHQASEAAVPADLAIDAVAGDAGLIADDGAAAAGESVEEGGLADVGAADDDQDRQFRRLRLLNGIAGGTAFLAR